jgi:hypothetical protein
MRLREFAPTNYEPLFRLPAPPNYSAAERKLYPREPIRAEISAFAPTLASAVRLALLKRDAVSGCAAVDVFAKDNSA